MTGVGPVDRPYRKRLLRSHTNTAMVVEGSRLKGKNDPEMELRVSSCLPSMHKTSIQFPTSHELISAPALGKWRREDETFKVILDYTWSLTSAYMRSDPSYSQKNKTNEQTKNQHKRNICVRYDVRLQTHIQEAETGVNYIGSSKATTVKPNQKMNLSRKNIAGHGGSGL